MVTIFIHGTLPPKPLLTLPHLGALFTCPLGLTPRSALNPAYLAGSLNFLEGEVYNFGWSGQLSNYARQEAAAQLSRLLATLHADSIRLVTHSHGGNVALYLVQEYCPIIDELILLACPVQKRTENYVHYPLFKNVYSLHSHSDVVQVLDPQGISLLFSSLKVEFTLSALNHFGPLFSERHFSPGGQVKQLRVVHPHRPFFHIEFILPPFMKQLHHLITFMAAASTQEELVYVIKQEADRPPLE